MTERLGVQIDYCPSCRGVWLDRGELDKIIEKAEGEGRVTAPVFHPLTEERPPAPGAPRPEQPVYRGHDDDDDDYRRKKKRKSFLGELLDFD